MTAEGGTRQEAIKRPRISACVLARDEEGRIGDCLKSLRAIVDEMIVVDNGSTDGTAAVARRLGATVVVRPELELDAARNCYLDAAQGDWILVVDCDERLDAAAGSLLVSAAANADLRTWGFTLGRYDYSGSGRWAAIPHMRFFRNMTSVRYSPGPIHTSPGAAILEQGGRLQPCAAYIHHLDLLFRPDQQAKRKRYRALLERHANGLDFLTCLRANEEAAAGETERARRTLEGLFVAPVDVRAMAWLLMAGLCRSMDELGASVAYAQKVVDLAMHHHPAHTAALAVLGDIAMRERRFADARAVCETAIESVPGAHWHLNLASVMLAVGDPGAAGRELRQASALNCYLRKTVIYGDPYGCTTFGFQTALFASTGNFIEELRNCARCAGNTVAMAHWQRCLDEPARSAELTAEVWPLLEPDRSARVDA